MSRSALIEDLRKTAGRLADVVAGLDEPALRFAPAGGGWSIADNVEHLALSEIGSGKMSRGKLVREPTPPDVMAAATKTDDWIDRTLLGREDRITAPEFVTPTGQWPTCAAALSAFMESRTATIQFLETTELDLTGYAFPHPRLGVLNGLQWVRFLSRHCERHLAQIDEIRRDPGFPA